MVAWQALEFDAEVGLGIELGGLACACCRLLGALLSVGGSLFRLGGCGALRCQLGLESGRFLTLGVL